MLNFRSSSYTLFAAKSIAALIVIDNSGGSERCALHGTVVGENRDVDRDLAPQKLMGTSWMLIRSLGLSHQLLWSILIGTSAIVSNLKPTVNI